MTTMTMTVERSNAAIAQVDRQRIKQGLGSAISMNVLSIGHSNRVSRRPYFRTPH
jgi:hypothetical protein